MSTTIGGSIYNGGPPPHAETIGDGTTTVFPITHNLGTQDTVESVYNVATGAEMYPPAVTVAHTSANVTTFTFATAPAANAVRVAIHA